MGNIWLFHGKEELTKKKSPCDAGFLAMGLAAVFAVVFVAPDVVVCLVILDEVVLWVKLGDETLLGAAGGFVVFVAGALVTSYGIIT
jgi:hypothetical protein